MDSVPLVCKMKIISRARGCGKTSALIRLSYETNKPILCVDNFRRKIILDLAFKLGYEIPKPITCLEIFNRSDGKRIDNNPVLIDDGENVLSCLIRRQVDFMTTSSEII